VEDTDHVRLVVERLRRIAGVTDSATARPVLLVDGWERLAAHTHGGLAAEVRALLEASTRSPLRALVTGGRAVLAGQLVPLMAQRLVLRLDDPVDLAMAGIPARAVPQHQPPGRALDVKTQHEVQIATIGDQPSHVLSQVSRRWITPGDDAQVPTTETQNCQWNRLRSTGARNSVGFAVCWPRSPFASCRAPQSVSVHLRRYDAAA
jgi:hypothetical protein